uniref:Uncharacterized protein n=1 Tax=Paraburkholderia sprentiae WSM5005 TaxID=754502 RepID=A0A1I9YIJ3_9BURK
MRSFVASFSLEGEALVVTFEGGEFAALDAVEGGTAAFDPASLDRESQLEFFLLRSMALVELPPILKISARFLSVAIAMQLFLKMRNASNPARKRGEPGRPVCPHGVATFVASIAQMSSFFALSQPNSFAHDPMQVGKR